MLFFTFLLLITAIGASAQSKTTVSGTLVADDKNEGNIGVVGATLELTNLQDYVEDARIDHLAHYGYLDWKWYDEGLVWAIQDYLSMKGDFTEKDVAYLKELGFVPEDFIEED